MTLRDHIRRALTTPCQGSYPIIFTGRGMARRVQRIPAVIGLFFCLVLGGGLVAQGGVNSFQGGVTFSQAGFSGPHAAGRQHNLGDVQQQDIEQVGGQRGAGVGQLKLAAKPGVMPGGNLHGHALEVAAVFGTPVDKGAGHGGDTAKKAAGQGAEDGSSDNVEWHGVLGVIVGYGIGSLAGPAITFWWLRRRGEI